MPLALPNVSDCPFGDPECSDDWPCDKCWRSNVGISPSHPLMQRVSVPLLTPRAPSGLGFFCVLRDPGSLSAHERETLSTTCERLGEGEAETIAQGALADLREQDHCRWCDARRASPHRLEGPLVITAVKS